MGHKRKKKQLGPRRKRMKRSARLQSVASWLKRFSGKNVLRGYCKRYGVDWRCAEIELKRPGIHLDPDYLGQREISEQQLAISHESNFAKHGSEKTRSNVGMNSTLLWKRTLPRSPKCRATCQFICALR